MKRLLLLIFAFIFLTPVLPGQNNESSGTLLASFVRIDITPEEPVMLYGYAQRKTPSEGIHDPLSARIAVFACGKKKVMFISTDIGSYPSDVYEALRKRLINETGLDDSEIFLTTIHSHSSPVLTLDENGNAANLEYTEALSGKLVKASKEAMKKLKPVQTGIGTGYSPVGSNRRETRQDGSVVLGRNPYGVTDKEVLVMKVSDSEGKPMAALFDYATHSTAMGAKNMLVSGDVLGLTAQFVEKILGSEVVSPVFAGASGNIDPWYRVLPEFNNEPGWVPEAVLLGTLLGEEVVTVFRKTKSDTQESIIRTAETIVNCPRRKPADGTPVPPGQSSTIPVRITAARIGDACFIGFNVEMLTEIGMKIKSGSPFSHTFIITHCNGSSGYLPPLELYKEGGYEITSTRFETGSAEMVTREALKLLHSL